MQHAAVQQLYVTQDKLLTTQAPLHASRQHTRQHTLPSLPKASFLSAQKQLSCNRCLLSSHVRYWCIKVHHLHQDTFSTMAQQGSLTDKKHRLVQLSQLRVHQSKHSLPSGHQCIAQQVQRRQACCTVHLDIIQYVIHLCMRNMTGRQAEQTLPAIAPALGHESISRVNFTDSKQPYHLAIAYALVRNSIANRKPKGSQCSSHYNVHLWHAGEVGRRHSRRGGSYTPRQQSRRYGQSPQQKHRQGLSPHVIPRKGRNAATHHTPRRNGRQAAYQEGERRSGGAHSSGRRTRHATAGQ